MSVFKSFVMGGYECADIVNKNGKRVNMLRETQHDIRVEEDYNLLFINGIHTVREGVCWSEVEKSPYTFDFSEVKYRIDAAEKYGIQQIWDLCHFGYPDGLHPAQPEFVKRFVGFCEAFAEFYKAYAKQQLLVVPIHDINFFSHYAEDNRASLPLSVQYGYEIKYHLCRAFIKGADMLRIVDPKCVVIMVETMHDFTPVTDAEKQFLRNEAMYYSLDIISGKICPELGGDLSLVDIIGITANSNLDKQPAISEILRTITNKYKKPVFVSGAPQPSMDHCEWLEDVTAECSRAAAKGAEVAGICVASVTDLPDWNNVEKTAECGIFNLDESRNRIPNSKFLQSVQLCQLSRINKRQQTFS